MAFDAAELLWEKRRRRYKGGDDPESQLAGFVAFCTEHVYIQHPGGKRLFDIRPQQVEVAKSYIENDKTICLKARQIGFTTVTMAFCLWRALFFDEFSIIILNKTERDAQYNLAMARFGYVNLSDEMRERLPRLQDRTVQRMTFSNGSKIESFPSNNNPARGRTASLMILDEWAFLPNPEEAWAAIQPATDVGGRIIAISTANGWGNMFHQTWQKARAGDNGFTPLFFPWNSLPERDAAWFEATCRDMAEWQRAQEYPESEDEAFIKSGNMFFDFRVLQRQPLEPARMGEMVNEGANELPKSRTFIDQVDGRLGLWSWPRINGVYVIGADVAGGLSDGDYSSAHVIDCNATTPPLAPQAAVCATWHGHIDPDLFAYELAALGWFYGTALLGVEANNHGLTTLKALQRLGYPRIYMRRRLGARFEKATQELGWWTSEASKPKMMDELAAALRADDLVVPDDATVVELRGYIRNEKGRLEGSPHDDRVISLAIANQMRQYATDPEFTPQDHHREFTIQWALDALERQEAAERTRRVIGAHNVRRPHP